MISDSTAQSSCSHRYRPWEYLGAVLRGPAKIAYDAAIADATIVAGAGGTPEANAATTLQNALTWIRNTYHTAEIQQSMKDQIPNMFQGMNESPLTFHTKLRHAVALAGYADGIRDQVTEQAFMAGIHRELALTVRSSPIVLNHQQKLEYAQRHWAVRNTNQDIMQQVLPTIMQQDMREPTIAQAILPPTVEWSKPREDPQMKELIDKMSQMTAHIHNVEARIDAQRPIQQFGRTPATGSNATPLRNTKCYRCNQEGHQAANCSLPDTRVCKRCGEGGHGASRCQAETNRIAQPNRYQMQLNPITFAEQDFATDNEQDDEEYEYVEAFAADTARRPGRPKKAAPYTTARPKVIKKREEKKTDGIEEDELLEEQIKEIVQADTDTATNADTIMSESAKEQKLRKSKKYHLNVWEEVSQMTIPVKVGQLAEIPTFRQQMRNGLSKAGPAFEVVQINQMNTGEEEDSDDEEDYTRKSSAYSQCQVEDHTVACIIDTGAGGCTISKTFLDEIGWEIDGPTKQTLIVADGYAAVPLGKVYDLPIRFGKLVIPITAIVVDTTSYDLVIGNTWLTKANAIIDMGARKMRLHWKGRKYEIPIDDERGIRPQMVQGNQMDHFVMNFQMKAMCKKMNRSAIIPQRKTKDAAGFDLSTVKNIELTPGESRVVGTGIAIKIPEGHYGQIKPRSSMAISGITIDGGVIDADYTGEIKLIIVNRHKTITAKIFGGDRVAQLVILPIWTGELQEVQNLEETKRGDQGFGSTGLNIVKIITELKHGNQSTDKHTYQIGEQLTSNQAQQLKKLTHQYEDVFATCFADIKLRQPKYLHDIDTGDHPPIKKMPYRTPPAYQEWQRNEIADMYKNDLVRYSNSPWAFPNVIAPKKGTDAASFAPRMCTDYRMLNDITVKDPHPIPRIDDTLAMLKNGAGVCSGLDLTAGYYQMGLTKRAIERSAFVTPDGHWEYLRMPFGLCNAPASFQRMMNGIFGDMVGKTLLVYLDDITVFTKTFKEHLIILEQVFKRLREEGLYLKPKKCTFAADRVTFLGFIVDKDGLRTDPAKVEAIASYPRPRNRTEIRAFLGLAMYYRRFVKNFATIAEPLNDLLRKNPQTKFWTTKHQNAFDQIKQALITSPVLAKPDWTKVFKLYTDACATGLGAILTQDDEQGHERVICYASRGTRGAEQNYESTKLECLAVVWAIKWFRYYLIGRHFEVITDHSALKWLFNKPDPQGLYARWIMTMQEYDFKVQYRKGKKHVNADVISRTPRTTGTQGRAAK